MSKNKTKLTDEIGFFTAMPETVIEMTPEIGSDAAFLFLYLRYRTNRDRGSAWPGYERMRKDIKWGNTRIKKAIQTLIDNDLVEVKKRFGQTNVYTLKPPDIGVSSDDTASSPVSGELIEDDSIPAMGDQFSQNGSEVFPNQELTQDVVKTDSVKMRLDIHSQDSWVQALIAIQDTYYRTTRFKNTGDFNKFWQPTEFGGQKDGIFTVLCQDEDQRAWLEDRGKSIAEKALVGILGERVEVEFVCG